MKKTFFILFILFTSIINAQQIALIGNSHDPDGVAPTVDLVVLSNFRITDANKDRVYFDSDLNVEGLTSTGFVISGKTISGNPTIDLDGLGGFFTVTVPFTFWDNNTIRLGENNNLNDVNSKCHNFTLTYIDNLIVEPSTTTDKYVSTAGSGTTCSEGSPCSITYAMANAVAGETWWIKKGLYNVTTTLNIIADGTATDPVKFIGYNVTPGDIVSNYYDYGVIMTDNEFPTFIGASVTTTQLFNLNNAHYVIMRNLQMTNAIRGVRANQSATYANNSSNIIFDRINGLLFGDDTVNDGHFITLNNSFGTPGLGHVGHLNCRIINCVGVNAGMSLFEIRGDGFCLFENNKGYNDRTGEPNSRIDYFIPFSGNNNIARNNHMENKVNLTSSSMHGIGVRGGERDVLGVDGTNNYNLIELNDVIAVKEAYYARNYGCNYNVFKDNVTSATGLMPNSEAVGALYVWGGADYNIFERNYILDVTIGIGWKNNDESSIIYTDIGTGNVFRNNIFKNLRWFHYFTSTIASSVVGTNYVYNNTIYDSTSMGYKATDVNGGSIIQTNNIFNNVPNEAVNGTPFADFSYTNNIMFDTGTWLDTVIGTNGNVDVDPVFADLIDFVPTISTTKTRLIGVYYDFNNIERPDPAQVGAVE